MRWLRREYWYPELSNLDEQERRAANNYLYEQSHKTKAFISACGVFGMIFLAVKATHIWGFFPPQLNAWIVFAWVTAFGTTLVVISIRSNKYLLRQYINAHCATGDTRFCADCGYSLRACPSTECPECGNAIPPKTLEWIKRNPS